jgi:hypothetical protein
LEVHWDFNSQSGNSLGSVGVHSLTLSYTSKSMKCDSQAHSWPTPLQALALVVSLKLGLCHIIYINACIHSMFEPKTSWKCIKVLPTKSLQNFNNTIKSLSLLCLAWNYWNNSNFNIRFCFQNWFKCFKWKHDLETYSIQRVLKSNLT